MKRIFVLLSLVLLSVLIAFPVDVQAQAKYGGRLVFGVESDFQQLDPHKSKATLEGNVFRLMCDCLVQADKNMKIKPYLAESWETSPDGLVWTFHLRKGVKFHNGREFTADDVKWNFERTMDPNIGATVRTRMLEVKECQVADRYTVKFILKQPSGSFLNALWNPYSLSFQMIAKECVDKDGKVTQPIGTGPFKFVEWKPNDYTRFVKNENYWIKGLPYLDEIIIKPIPDAVVRLSALQSGDVDMARMLLVDEVAKLMKKPTPKTVYNLKEGFGWNEMVWINNSKPPFNDVRVRQAMALGIDKKEIESAVTFGYGEVANQAFARNNFWRTDVPEKPRDVAKAKALLKEAGYPNGLDVTLLTSPAYAEWIAASTVIQEQLKDIGMRIKLEITDWPAQIKKMTAGEFSIAFGAVAMYNDPEHLYRGYIVPGGPFSWIQGSGYNNPKVTEILNRAAKELDQEKRKVMYKQIVELTNEDYPWLVTFISPIGLGWRDHVKGYSPDQVVFCWEGGGLQYTWLDK
jgi:peptide/nickel transport system substrate-binding protein